MMARRIARRVIGALIAASVAASAAAAQEPDVSADSDDGADPTSDVHRAAGTIVSRYGLPDAPAATFLGASAGSITRPATPRDLLFALSSGIDEHGNARQGFALEATPFALVPGFHVSLDRYREHGFAPSYLLANLQVSIAATRAAGDSGATEVAYGVHLIVLDDADPMRDDALLDELGDSVTSCRPRAPAPGIPPADSARDITPELRDILTGRRDARLRCLTQRTRTPVHRFVREHWNASAVSLAYAGGERFGGSLLARRRHLGDRIWGTAALRLGKHAQGALYADYTHQRPVDDQPAYDAATGGLRGTVGSPSIDAFGEWLVQWRAATSGVAARAHAWSAGIEVRAADALWLSAGFGTRFARDAAPERVLLLAGLRWGISTRPWFSPEQ